ncbi:uncharacterized protein JN550_002005 [Neoarthrinium moseri]|uniref:uncharacterized protein n=1 Tax=Neoarthrinium moseri TaxID=1658444 RepID=UPI001FDE8E33|nr:uncharacterized protein JN550_002005 [Neoarthrinium moseri]KAI1875719.1 hypothetical protein JN550_002005 [Neoarthrinium moseri]
MDANGGQQCRQSDSHSFREFIQGERESAQISPATAADESGQGVSFQETASQSPIAQRHISRAEGHRAPLSSSWITDEELWEIDSAFSRTVDGLLDKSFGFNLGRFQGSSSFPPLLFDEGLGVALCIRRSRAAEGTGPITFSSKDDIVFAKKLRDLVAEVNSSSFIHVDLIWSIYITDFFDLHPPSSPPKWWRPGADMDTEERELTSFALADIQDVADNDQAMTPVELGQSDEPPIASTSDDPEEVHHREASASYHRRYAVSSVDGPQWLPSKPKRPILSPLRIPQQPILSVARQSLPRSRRGVRTAASSKLEAGNSKTSELPKALKAKPQVSTTRPPWRPAGSILG